MLQSPIQDTTAPLKLLSMVAPNYFVATSAVASGTGPNGPPPNDPDATAARIWANALRSKIANAGGVISQLKRSLKLSNVLQLVANLVSTTSVTTLLALLLGTSSVTYQVTAAVIALASASMPLIASAIQNNITGKSRSDQLASLAEDVSKAEVLAQRLEIWAAIPQPRPTVDPNDFAKAQALVTSFIQETLTA